MTRRERKALKIILVITLMKDKATNEIMELLQDYKNNIIYYIIDDNCESDAYWIDVNKFKNNKKIIYPEQIFKYI